MKNLKMFAIAVMAFAVMAMGVHATQVPGSKYQYENKDCGDSCVAKIGEHYYIMLDGALLDAADNEGTIELLKDITSAELGSSIATAVTLDKSVTINLGSYNLDLDSNSFTVNDKATLTIKGTGEVETTDDYLADVQKGGSFVTEGGLLLTATKAVATTAGKVVIGAGAEVTPGSESVVTVTAHTADVTINATVGKEGSEFTHPLVDLSGITAVPVRNTTGAKVTFAGGEYYVKDVTPLTVKNGVTVVINNGTIHSIKTAILVGADGKLELNGGEVTGPGRMLSIYGGDTTVNGTNLKSTAASAITVDPSSAKGTLTIKRGTIVSEADGKSALLVESGKVVIKVEGATFEAGKDTPAINIDDALLTGMAENGKADNFKGMLTGGKYLYMIIGGTADKKYSPEDVAKYIIAEGLEERTEGNYKLLGNGAGDTPVDPEPSNPSDIPPVPQTNDNILVYAGLGLVSLASVAFTAKKRED